MNSEWVEAVLSHENLSPPWRQVMEELLLWRKLGRISEKDGHPDIEIDCDEDGNYTCPICGEYLGNGECISIEGYLRGG